MKPESDLRISDVTAWEVDIPLAERFTIAQGSLTVARNVFIRIELESGVVGYGECAPFPDLTGEDRPGTLKAIDELRAILIGRSAAAYRITSRLMAEAAREHAAARCGLEMAMLDAYCRALDVPLWAFLGGEVATDCETDVTIPMLGRDRCVQLADQWHERGFRRLKLKVGGDLASDLETIRSIAARYPDVEFVLDANQGFSEADAVALINSLRRNDLNIRLLEQPVDKLDLATMSILRRRAPFPLCADESVASLQDAMRLIEADAADVVNIKIMKCGVIEALEIATLAHSFGYGVMYGGMVETRLAMGCSLAIAAAYGPVHTLDLDTPLLMAEDPLIGGYTYDGPRLLPTNAPGLGIEPRPECAHAP